MRYMVIFEKSENSYGAYVPNLPGCVAVGESLEEVRHLIREAIEFHIEGLREEISPVPPPSSTVEFIEVDDAEINPAFVQYTEGLEEKFQELMKMTPITMEKPLRNAPEGGVYLFSEGDRHLYAGRTKRKISERLRGHVNAGKDCTFAFRLAREKTGKTEASYSGEETRKELLKDCNFVRAYKEAKKRIRKMDIRWVHEPDSTRQALLEIYISVVLNTPYNDFDTH